MQITSDEVNFLIFRYLQEAGELLIILGGVMIMANGMHNAECIGVHSPTTSIIPVAFYFTFDLTMKPTVPTLTIEKTKRFCAFSIYLHQ